MTLMAEIESPYTVTEAAKRAGVSRETVLRALRGKLLRGHTIGARGDWRIERADFQAWIAAGAPTKPPKPKE